MFVKPAPGLLVRDPHSHVHMPEAGRHVPDHDLEWVRLIQFGDVVAADEPVEAPASQPTAIKVEALNTMTADLASAVATQEHDQ